MSGLHPRYRGAIEALRDLAQYLGDQDAIAVCADALKGDPASLVRCGSALGVSLRVLRGETREAHFVCPRCNRASFNPTDALEGYCGACHDWTAPPRVQP